MIDNAENHAKKYWNGFDFVKGILIILVFAGHIISGEVRETYPRYLIYSFHMPLFIGVSGFLLNIEKLNIQIIPLIKKYWNRMICPWIIAVAVFAVAVIFVDRPQIGVKYFVTAYLHPYYHLWYVLGFLSYLVISCVLWRIFKNARCKWIWILIISAFISIVSQWELPGFLFHDGILGTIYEGVHYDFRLYNLIFFAGGIYLRYRYEHEAFIFSSKIMEGIRICSIISFFIVSVLFFFDYANIEKILFFIMNGSLLGVVIYDCVNRKMPGSRFIEFLGKYSFPIYLYHVFCKPLAGIFCAEGTAGYYTVCAAGFIIGCVLIGFLRRVKFLNTVLFGSTTSSLKAE